MMTVLIFLAILVLLVISHELGHFVVARWSGMRVYEFGFGFPPRLCGWYRDPVTKKIVWVGGKVNREQLPATLYSLNWLPLGGFVSIKGEDADTVDEDSFTAKSLPKKLATVAAGVVMNVLLAAVLLSIGFMFGLPQTIDDKTDLSMVRNRHLEIMEVLPNKPAARAGFNEGDLIVQVDALEVPRLTALQQYLDQHRGVGVQLTIQRQGQVITKSVQPEFFPELNRGGIGVGLAEVGVVRYPWYEALWRGMLSAGWYFGQIARSFTSLIAGLFIGKGVGAEVAGPVGIAVMTGKVARLGFNYLLQFVALLSLNLAFINILPIPALDGGRILFLCIGRFVHRPFVEKYERAIHSIGFILLLLLVVMVTIKDMGTFGGSLLSWLKTIL